MPSGPYTFNPAVWRSFNLTLSNKNFDNQMKEFQKQLADFASLIQQLLTANGVAAMLNGTLGLLSSSMTKKITDLGTITTDQTVPVGGAEFVWVYLTSAVNQTRILTLSNLPQGAVVLVNPNISANTLTLKMAATDPSGNVYSIASWTTTTGAVTNLVTVGVTPPANEAILFGFTGFVGGSSTPRLNFLFI